MGTSIPCLQSHGPLNSRVLTSEAFTRILLNVHEAMAPGQAVAAHAQGAIVPPCHLTQSIRLGVILANLSKS